MKPTNLTSLTSLWTAARRYFFLLAWALVLTNAAKGQAVVVVTNTSDVVNGITGSIDFLNASDGGDGISLREAMEAANKTPNGTAPDEIHFNIPGAGPHTIQPHSGLPTVTDPVVIDGYTQPGASENTNTAGSGLGLNTVLMIEMDGSDAPGSGLFIEAGSTTVRGLVLNRYPNKAIEMLYLGGNRIEGNFIGTDVTGTVDLGNAISGVVIAAGSSNNVVGGTDPGARNLISGNDNDGIVISGYPVAVTGNAVLGNFIGTDVNGNVALSNGSPSTNEWASGIVLVNSASNNVVGGTDPGARNLISGNTEYGVLIRSDASDNVVQGNYIGTDVTGTVTDAELGNGSPNLSADGGVGVVGGSMNNTIGGGAPGAGNLISGNDNAGIQLSTNATANTVQGNKIGTDKTGMAALGNSKGVSIGYGAHHNIIGTNSDGTDDSTEGNLISGNQSNGVFIHGSSSGSGADNNVIAGNYIGTNVTGTQALGNGSGIRIHQPSGPSSAPQFNRIGTDGDGVADAEERNLIAGNNAEGIRIEGDNTTVAGNYIGTDVTGTLALGNEGVGANIVDGQWNRVGTNSDGVADLAERNLISANGGGVNITGLSAQHNTVAGNFIGTDVSGTNLLGNGSRGVSISGGASFNWIGTNGDGVRDLTERNVISANGEAGILISTSDHNVVAGNYIGTDVTGANPLGNGLHGVWLSGTGTPVASNRIGTDADGTADAEEANLIAFNTEAGVAVTAYTGDLMSVGNRVQGNAIHSNGGLGIDLVGATEDPTGVTANDSGDVDTGPNTLQNFPVISSAASGASSTTIDGTLDSTPSTAFTLEFFASSAADPSSHGEGETFLGSTSITTDGSGNAGFLVTFSAVAPVGASITATATATGGNTSEFSAHVVAANTPAGTDVDVQPVDPTTGNAPVTLTFSDVTEAGTTSLTTSDGGPPPPSGFRLGNPPTYYDLSTTASFSETITITVCIDYSDIQFGNEEALQLLHREVDTMGNEIWIDQTVSLDTDSNIICADVDSFSFFLVAEGGLPPTVNAVTAQVDPVEVDTEITASADFTDPDDGDTHTAEWDWGDDTPPTAGTVTEPNEEPGTVSGTHTYHTPGVYTVKVTVSDSVDESEAVFQFVVVFDPDGGFVTGGGWIDSPAGAYPADPLLTGTANFGFISKYKQGQSTPTGQTEFQYQLADLNFHSSTYEWLVVAGPHAKYKGTGTINQAGNYGFMLTATDEKLTPSTDEDLFRIKIWDKDNGDAVVYDNQMDESDDSNAGTAIAGGNIVIHSGGNGGGPNKTGEQADPVADSAEVPEVYALAQNYPNPFNPSTEIRFDLPEASVVRLVVYDVMGRAVARLVDGSLPAGVHRVSWQAGSLPSGVYFYAIQAGAFRAVRHMLLIK